MLSGQTAGTLKRKPGACRVLGLAVLVFRGDLAKDGELLVLRHENPTAAWVTQAARNLVMDLQDSGHHVKYLIRDRDGKYPALFDAILADAGIAIVRSGIQMPRMNSIMERWVLTCRRELLDRTLIWNQPHLLHALRQYETFYNQHRPHQGLANPRPLNLLPEPITDPDHLTRLHVRRRDRLGGILHEYHRAA